MPSDSGPISSPARLALLLNRIDNQDEVGVFVDLSDLIAAAWPNGRSMDQ